jgi:hypothetical protein
MFRAGLQAPDIGPALLTMLRTVAGLRDRAPRPWTGSWTEPSVQPVRSGPSAARLRGIRAASAPDARGRSSHNPSVVGSSPTRPTCGSYVRQRSIVDRFVDRCRRHRAWCRHPKYPFRSHRATASRCAHPGRSRLRRRRHRHSYPVKQPAAGRDLDIDTHTWNAMLRRLGLTASNLHWQKQLPATT